MYFTTCATCGDVLEVTYVGQEAHPTCRPTEVMRLTQRWCEAARRGDGAQAELFQAEIDKTDRVVPSLGGSALWYVSVGWPVFPLLPNSKRPATRNGLNDATTDAGRIDSWWSRHPDSNVGVATGRAFDVVDVDGPVGIKSMAGLSEDALPDVHGKVSTPRGLHYFVLPTGDGNRVGVLPGVDYRGVGGYVCAPPSVVDGRRWVWLIPPSPKIAACGAS
jgi:hypothetical protein